MSDVVLFERKPVDYSLLVPLGLWLSEIGLAALHFQRECVIFMISGTVCGT